MRVINYTREKTLARKKSMKTRRQETEKKYKVQEYWPTGGKWRDICATTE